MKKTKTLNKKTQKILFNKKYSIININALRFLIVVFIQIKRQVYKALSLGQKVRDWLLWN